MGGEDAGRPNDGGPCVLGTPAIDWLEDRLHATGRCHGTVISRR